MQTTRLGRTDMMVSRLGFGGVPIQRLSEDEAVATVRGCLDLGVNFIDTANSYTTSEERIGRAIQGRREGLVLATKSWARTREVAEQHLELSLKRLGVETIDLYQFHGVSDRQSLKAVLDPSGPMAVLREARAAGTIRHIGITSHSTDVAIEAIKSDQFETIQVPFNFITCEPADQLLPLAREHDVGFIAMKPLAGGRLSNAVIAFKYLFQFADVVPIPGIEMVEEMEELLSVLEGDRELTGGEQLTIQRMRDELGTRFCRRCDYCQPCSQGIPISSAIAISNPEKAMPPEQLFHGWVDGVLSKAAECNECGECEERCPYHLPIREMIAEEVAWYQGEKKAYEQGLPR
jgi:predicted aldo/keto reductase-like oxidoreductase